MSTEKLDQRGRIVTKIRAQQHSNHTSYMAEFMDRLVNDELAELASEELARQRAEAKERG